MSRYLAVLGNGEWCGVGCVEDDKFSIVLHLSIQPNTD